jgi:hypothetical protein
LKRSISRASKKMKKSSFVFLISFVGILFFANAHAATLSQSDYSVTFGSNAGDRTYYMPSASLGLASGGEISDVHFALERYIPDGTKWSISLYTGCSDNAIADCSTTIGLTHDAPSDTELYGESGSVGVFDEVYTAPSSTFFAGNVIFKLSNYYGFNTYGTSTAVYPGQVFTNANPSVIPGNLYFLIDYGTGPESFHFNFPIEGSTTPDFPSWKIYDPFTAFSASTSLDIFCSQSTTSWQSCAATQFHVNNAAYTIYKNIPLYLPAYVAPVHWYAYAEYKDPGLGSDVTTTILDFYIDPNSTGTADTFPSLSGGSTSSTIPTTANCQFTSSSIFVDPVGVIQNGICNALTFLFIPNEPQKADLSLRFGAIQAAVSKKPPFGYIGSAVTALSALQEPTSSTSTPLIDASATAALAPVIGPLDVGMASIIGLLLLLWYFHRSRHIEL